MLPSTILIFRARVVGDAEASLKAVTSAVETNVSGTMGRNGTFDTGMEARLRVGHP